MADLMSHKAKADEVLAEGVAQKLRGRGFQAWVVRDAQEALAKVLELVPEGASVGIPGSVTIRQIGLPEALDRRGNRVIHHWKEMTPEERKRVLVEEICADVFLSSVNALSQEGLIVNVDGTGNRVAGISFGPGKLILVAGINKITWDLESALKRAKASAAPNGLRLNSSVPCAKTGTCVDCQVPDRMCRVVSILERCPAGRDAHVIIVLQELGY
ncbi:MAG: lactate utilization protein [Thermanaerothrix sp.]|nr:lactate utilization protein [Thermanaerothrix sp.]